MLLFLTNSRMTSILMHVFFFSIQVGLAAVQLASAYGMKVIGTAGTAEGENVVKQAGASLVFNHRQDGYVQQILVGTILLA